MVMTMAQKQETTTTHSDDDSALLCPSSSSITTSGGGGGDGKMSVFSDFQRMWQQRFPQSSLSDAWELDVRASLQRHKQKMTDLTKELEQEQLYVEYLERLLNDVEKQRETESGDPAQVIDSDTKTLCGLDVSRSKVKGNSDVMHFYLNYLFIIWCKNALRNFFLFANSFSL